MYDVHVSAVRLDVEHACVIRATLELNDDKCLNTRLQKKAQGDMMEG